MTIESFALIVFILLTCFDSPAVQTECRCFAELTSTNSTTFCRNLVLSVSRRRKRLPYVSDGLSLCFARVPCSCKLSVSQRRRHAFSNVQRESLSTSCVWCTNSIGITDNRNRHTMQHHSDEQNDVTTSALVGCSEHTENPADNDQSLRGIGSPASTKISWRSFDFESLIESPDQVMDILTKRKVDSKTYELLEDLTATGTLIKCLKNTVEEAKVKRKKLSEEISSLLSKTNSPDSASTSVMQLFRWTA
eukprot:GHVQ01012155.1.p1 GENE.GHVQ01012155.1~~GHVQ01012155.1.p1  ORF type:complete len:249 (-),score=19.49 GHVQ01012155.1:1031-1777(-)